MFARYVAIGDSSTEGLDDPDGRGGYRGWANRLAERVAAAQSTPLLYANLAIRGRSTREILDEQLAPALAMQPDLVTLFTGTNDVVKRRFDADTVGRDVEIMQRTLVQNGATVLGFTLPDLSLVLPLGRPIAGRVRALNDALRHASASSGAVLVDLAKHAVGSDPRMWSLDRLHANSAGHERIAAALAWALRLPGTDDSWSHPLPTEWRRPLGATIMAEFRWQRDYFLPWLWRHLRGRSSGDNRGPKRPALSEVVKD
ncbi:MAG: lysophospholipase [Gemmatimonadetes bacterium]|nr:lysophospholipase [Gemmatimonadota bacterium]